MAAIASVQPVNLSSSVLAELTSKLGKQPEIREVEVSDGESTHEEITVVQGISQIGIVHDHVAVRSSLHKEAVHLRQDLQLHLRSVMRTGDDMLSRIRGVIEELDTAVHARQLAEGELVDVEAKRDIIKKQLDQTTKECTVLRIRLLEMSKARDRAEIDLESAKGLLLEKTEECNELKRESARLHTQIAEISQKLLEYTSRLSEAEKKIRFHVTEITKLKVELESYKTEIINLTKMNTTIAEELKVTRFENKDLKISLEKLRVELIGMTTKLTTITAELSAAKIEVEAYKVERDQAIINLELSIKDRNSAITLAEEAVLAKEDAIVSRDQAIYTEQITNAKWVRDSSLLEDCQRSLTSIRETLVVVTRDRDEAIENSENWEHLRDEAIENFREADRARHHLHDQLVKAREAKKEAYENVKHAKEQVVKVERSRDIILKEKEQVEIVLTKTVQEKNAAIAAQLKTAEEYIEADRERDEAIRRSEEIEDLFQETEKALEVAVAKLDGSQTAEKAATFKVEQLTAKVEGYQKSEATWKADKTELSGKLNAAEATAAKATKELADQQDKHAKETAVLRKELSAAQTNGQELIDSNRQLVEDKSSLSKELTTAKKDIATYKKSFDSPIPEAAGILIRHIFFGSVRITSANVYQKVLDSYTHQDGCSFTVNSKFVEGADPDHQSTMMHSRYLAVYYAVRNKNGVLVDKLPQWFKEGSKDNKFNP